MKCMSYIYDKQQALYNTFSFNCQTLKTCVSKLQQSGTVCRKISSYTVGYN
jgi:hypothetical protein